METHLTIEQVLFDTEDAIIHDAYVGFKNDYLCLHSLLRKYKPQSYFEIGTCTAEGLSVACNAIYKYNPKAKVYSLDLPYETMRQNSKQYPIGENGEDRVGSAAKFPYTQLRGDSMTFSFADYPCEGYFIDGEHDYEHPRHETAMVLIEQPKIIIWHDADIPEVWKAITTAMSDYYLDMDSENGEKEYELYRVTDTRIAYALRK